MKLHHLRNAPGRVIANQLEALNHCPVTRANLRARLSEAGLLERVTIPEDGDTIAL